MRIRITRHPFVHRHRLFIITPLWECAVSSESWVRNRLQKTKISNGTGLVASRLMQTVVRQLPSLEGD